MQNLTALLYPCYHGEDLFSVFKNTNLLEGDVIRYYRQILDRIGQIRNATPDHMLRDRLDYLQAGVQKFIADVDVI